MSRGAFLDSVPVVRRFHHESFADLQGLAARKDGQTISVCIPTLNERATIREIVACVRRELMEAVSLVDEIVVIDSDSDDGTREIAAAAGARVLRAAEIDPRADGITGKGENLWKALHVAGGSLICYVDGDIANFHPGFVAGLVGPLLTEPDVDYVKGYYERPLAGNGEAGNSAGGRVSEILVRPFLSLFYPELSDILQPLAGEYAARRETLESLAFPTGYGVEIAHLIDLAASGRSARIAQTDLVRRVHRNREDGELGDTAFAILKVLLRRLERDGRVSVHTPVPDLHRRWLIEATGVQAVERLIPEPERPPIRPQD